jgi:hypothetical protein
MTRGKRPGSRRGTPSGLPLVAFVALVAACGGAPSSPDGLPVGSSTAALHPIVDFAFESLDARPVSSDATRGKVAVLAFVTTGSLMAQAQVDFLVAMAKNDADRVSYAVIALEERQNRELVQLYEKTLAIPFPVALADEATRGGGGPFGDVTAVPVTLVLDRTGRVALRVEGRVAKSDEIRSAMRGL